MDGLTKKELIEETKAPAYTVDYLARNGRLQYVKAPNGKGTTAVYENSCIGIVLEHIKKNS